MDAATVNAVVDKLRDLTAAKFVDRGLSAPIFEATVTSNGGKRVEKVLISKEGADFFARRENEPSVYQLDAQAVADLQKAASTVKAYQLPKPDTKKK